MIEKIRAVATSVLKNLAQSIRQQGAAYPHLTDSLENANPA